MQLEYIFVIGVLIGSASASEAGSGGNPNGVVRRKMIKPKMDHAKALSMLGFTTSRALDPSSGQDAKGELNAALSRRMAELEKKKRLAKQKDKTAVCDKASSLPGFFLDISKKTQAQKTQGWKKLKGIFRKTQAFSQKTQDFANSTS